MYEQVNNPYAMAASQHARIHWKAPTTMVSSMVLGIAFIIGHHFFYQSLHLHPTGNVAFAQEVNIGIGTAFTFVVRMFLIVAVATAYWQLFWRQVKQKPTSLSSLDTLHSIMGNAFQFFKVGTLIRFPLLTLVAAILW
jgi:hypothetical protein